jgi:predicted dinucleotide-binding enzyme
MNIGIIGAAAVGETMAAAFIQAGHDVLLSNRRGPQSLAPLINKLGPKAQAVTVAQSAACPVVLLAIPWTKVTEVLDSVVQWQAQVVLDATNQFLNYAPDFRTADLGDDTSSEIVARRIPDAKVVKVFNTLPVTGFFADRPSGYRRVAFMAGDHGDAKGLVKGLIESLGLVPIDLGSLRSGGALMQLGGALNGVELLRPDGR